MSISTLNAASLSILDHIHTAKPFSTTFYEQAPERVARDLIGAVIVKQEGENVLAGRIVETEAYLHTGDAASHSHKGKTARNEAMFGEAGTLYVYKIYGIHLCANIVTEQAGIGSAVLLRAVEPLLGLDTMFVRRRVRTIKELCNGPGKFAQAFGITLQDNFAPIAETDSASSWMIFPTSEQVNIGISARIGITKDAHLPLRFFDNNSEFVSKGKLSFVQT